MPFEQNIFINCPFDSAYKPILQTLVFGSVYLGYRPLLSETVNAANSRISGIQKLIAQAKYSVHDLSRMESSKKNELARFNMPFELGIDIGCRKFGKKNHRTKCFLIFDKERYRYQQAISDISGNDIEVHENEPEIALRKFRNWIRKIEERHIDSANKIWRLYNEFMGDFYDVAREDELSKDDMDEMPWDEFCYYIGEWVMGRQNFNYRGE
ncbi:MAG: hypothetical protein ACPG7E_07310 [Marinirhabdus sp.]